MSKKDYQKRIKAYLKSYKIIKAKLKTDKSLLELYNKNDFLRAIDYSKDKVQSSNKVSQEDLIIMNIEKKEELEISIKENELRIQAIESVIEALNDREKFIVDEMFLKGNTAVNVAQKLYIDRSSVYRYLDKVYDLLGIVIFGERYLAA